MASKKKSTTIDFPFNDYLYDFLKKEQKKVYHSFYPLTKKFLDFNNPQKNANAYLRQPQFDALEVYVFLKEFAGNRRLYEIFEEWYNRTGIFEGRQFAGRDRYGQRTLFGVEEDNQEASKDTFQQVFERIKAAGQKYPNYIFALTMGLGKTVLMATSIFYEFLLANKYPKDLKYCHNALIFAPDKTVLESLREIIDFDKSKIIPPEYINWLDTNLKFHFLEENGDTLNTLDGSMFNVIISNTQKIILKKNRKNKTAIQTLFGAEPKKYHLVSAFSDLAQQAGVEDIDNEIDLITNQRFAKLLRLKQLGVYVDEAHHIFGTALADALMDTKKASSLRVTINELAENLKVLGSRLVACYNYTGTPYVGKQLLPEVVYAYGLKAAIDNRYLKKVRIKGYANIKKQTKTFCRIAITEFWEKNGQRRVEGLLPKLAFFASSIEELQNELKPAIEEVLAELNIPASKILVNVGDSKITKADDLREFKQLDWPSSEKQFILLVGKGKEGWNCRSLFGVALHRQPKSKVFVLQATMRCLRQIGDKQTQETGLVFLSDENVKILNDELQDNYRITVDGLNNSGDNDKLEVEIRIVPPPVVIKIKRTKKLYRTVEKKLVDKINFKLKEVDIDKYKIMESERKLDDLSKHLTSDKDVTKYKDKQYFSEMLLTAEIARYLNISPILVKNILINSTEGITQICREVNQYNELLYDVIIPKLFEALFEIEEYEKQEEVELNLVKNPSEGYYRFLCKKDFLASLSDPTFSIYKDKSFHLDNYCFDSRPELNYFYHKLKNDDNIDKIWFTGMLTHGQTEFIVNYIDPETHCVRSYYPDFLLKMKNGTYSIVEIKGDNKIDDAVVQAKADYAEQMASASHMTYQIIKSSEIKLIL